MKRFCMFVMAGFIALASQGCASSADTAEPTATVAPPDVMVDDGSVDWQRGELDKNASGIPMLTVYRTDGGGNEYMDIESYVAGVLAGEMKNDWPIEALRAQAILARTYAVKFISEKESKYEGADISTDIEEAQAYNAGAVNERVTQAARDTRGIVMVSDGKLPYAWFHAHSGGMTALAREGLGYNKPEPVHTLVTRGMETEDAPPEARAWKATFTFSEIGAACAKQGIGVTVGESTIVRLGDMGDSGRAVTLFIGDDEVSAPELRIALGSTKMRSTLLSDISVSSVGVTFKGKGYGHGVGMSQWGAYAMAKDGASAKDILNHYFKDIELYRLWGEEASASR